MKDQKSKQLMTLAQVLPNPSTQNADCRFIIRDVWSDNLHEEMQIIRDVVEKYPYISMVCIFMVQTQCIRGFLIWGRAWFRIPSSRGSWLGP